MDSGKEKGTRTIVPYLESGNYTDPSRSVHGPVSLYWCVLFIRRGMGVCVGVAAADVVIVVSGETTRLGEFSLGE